jgi:hypothetical protein
VCIVHVYVVHMCVVCAMHVRVHMCCVCVMCSDIKIYRLRGVVKISLIIILE